MPFIAVLLTLGIGWCSTQSLGKISVFTGYGHFGLNLCQLVIGAVVVLPMALHLGQWISPVWPFGPAERALVLSFVIHAIIYAGYVRLAALAGAVFATQISDVETAAGIGWAILLLGERFGPLVLFSAALMAFGLWLLRPEGLRIGRQV